MQLKIEDVDKGAIKVMRIGESINFANVRDFNTQANKILDEGVKRLLLDLEKVDFCNSHGFAVMINLYLKISKSGGRFAILRPQKAIVEVLNITKMDSIIPIFQEEGKALEALRSE